MAVSSVRRRRRRAVVAADAVELRRVVENAFEERLCPGRMMSIRSIGFSAESLDIDEEAAVGDLGGAAAVVAAAVAASIGAVAAADVGCDYAAAAIALDAFVVAASQTVRE